jgi:hypothetical protein
VSLDGPALWTYTPGLEPIMTSPNRAPPCETAAPARNFSISTEQRVSAIVGGPPAYVRRKRAIEDLERTVVRILAERCAEASARGIDRREHARDRAPTRAVERLRDLVARHNRWYPIEANLPMHPRTGEILDRTGEPWRPMRMPTLDDLLARALVQEATESGRDRGG